MFRLLLSPFAGRSINRFAQTLNVVFVTVSNSRRIWKQTASMTADYAVSIAALWIAYTLRFDTTLAENNAVSHVFLVVPAGTVCLFTALGVYRWVVRSANLRLFNQIVKGSLLSAVFFLLVIYVAPPYGDHPLFLFAIYGLMLLAGACGLRLVWQGLFSTGNRGEPVAIYGAGAAGQQLARSLSLGAEYRPVLFIDDNPRLAGSLIAGLPVVAGTSAIGGTDELSRAVRARDVLKIVLAIPSTSAKAYSAKLNELERLCLPLLTTPGFAELTSGDAHVDEIRDISISDILGRQEVPPNLALLGRCVSTKSVLVTGGGGSIGSELCRQIMAQRPACLVIVDNSEENLYHITEELTDGTNGNPVSPRSVIKPVLCSVADQARMECILADNKIDTVYHAAAYKHVPIVEAHPEQGVEINIFGTLSILDAALSFGVGHFVLISTDKAVRPTNSMGATKRIAELILQAKSVSAKNTKICMVRFGNVLGSSGSVVPKFKRQIEAGGPITLTSPDIKRYFMTIPEAAQLVMQAGAIAKGGDVFVLDMGELVRIEDMARTMVRLYGKKLRDETGNPDDIDIVVQGLRPGEKMIEELFLTNKHEATILPKVSTASESSTPWCELYQQLAVLRGLIEEGDRSLLRDKLIDMAFLDNAPKSGAGRSKNYPTSIGDVSRMNESCRAVGTS